MDNNITVIRSKRKSIEIQIKPDGSVRIHAPLFASDSEIECFYSSKRRWVELHTAQLERQRKIAEKNQRMTDDEIADLKNKAKEYISGRVKLYSKIIGVEYNNISIKLMKTMWGSCSAKKNLNFNCLLMLAPKESIDSVVVHELCHLKEMNHSKRFYKLVYQYFPDYNIHNDWLKKNGNIILARAFGLF